MTATNMKIDAYLRRVRRGLRALPGAEVTDILNELRIHITERAQSSGRPAEDAVDSALESLGSPEQIAALYVTEDLVSKAQSSRAPWTILRTLFHWSTLSILGFGVFMICLIGYSIGVSFFLAAVMKPIHPQGVGLWYQSAEPGHFSLHLGGFAPHTGQERELLGWWLVPVGCSLGGGTILLTTHFALWTLGRLRRSRKKSLP